jgi:hypothetical protein
VRDLDASAVLDAVVERRRAADRAEAELLALAVQWVDLDPVTPDQLAATFPTQRAGGLVGALGPSFFDRAPLAGAGTPAVAEYAVAELAAALGLSHAAGLALVSEAVQLCYRLPPAVGAGAGGFPAGLEGPPGRPGHHQLSADAVGFVDRHLAVTARSNRIPGRVRLRPSAAPADQEWGCFYLRPLAPYLERTHTRLACRRGGFARRPLPRSGWWTTPRSGRRRPRSYVSSRAGPRRGTPHRSCSAAFPWFLRRPQP